MRKEILQGRKGEEECRGEECKAGRERVGAKGRKEADLEGREC